MFVKEAYKPSPDSQKLWVEAARLMLLQQAKWERRIGAMRFASMAFCCEDDTGSTTDDDWNLLLSPTPKDNKDLAGDQSHG